MRRTALFAIAALFITSCGDNRVTEPRLATPGIALHADGVDPLTGASISTNKDDYSPGEIVHVSGAGWEPGENVHLDMSELPDTHPDVTMDVTADSVGAFSVHFYDVQDHDLGVTFTLTATGGSSGSQATAVFTDGSTVLSIVSIAPASPTPSGLFDINVSVDINGAGGGRLWKGTGWSIDAGATTCVNTADHSANGTYTATLTNATAPATSGPHTLHVQAYDDDLCANATGGDKTLAFNVAPPPNTAPVLAAIGNKNVNELALLSFTATATDDGKPVVPGALTFTIANPASGTFPTGAAITSGGAFTWTPTEAQGPGTYRVKIVVSDGALSDEEEIEIVVAEVNEAPVLTAIGNKNVNELALLSFSATATDDQPQSQLTFTLANPASGTYPTGAAITAAGAFTWTPAEDQGPGTYRVKVVVTDGSLQSDEEEIEIVVAEVNVAPVLAAIGNKSVDELTLLSFTATATDADLPANTLTFSLASPASGTYPTGAAITAGGAFTWTPTEAQGPGTYRVKIVVSDGSLTDEEEIEIAVAEVNSAPALTVPAGFSTQWGVAPNSVNATAVDNDIPSNTLTFAKVSGPSWATVAADGTISFTTIPVSDVGAQSVCVKVTDNGTPSLSDGAAGNKCFTITVQVRPTTLTYDGKTAGQYSDKSTLSATLTDNGAGSLNGSTISGATIAFTFNAASAGSNSTNGSGQASILYTVSNGAGSYTVGATFTAASGYSGSTASTSFVVSKENAAISSSVASIPVSQASFTIPVTVKELLTGGNEPLPQDGAVAGSIANVTAVTAKITGFATNTSYTGTCVAGSATSGYGTKSFTCSFNGGPFVVDAYDLEVNIVANSYFDGPAYEDAFTVFDPNAGFATGGGHFILDGDRVNFGFSYTQSKGNGGLRSGFVTVRHMANGGVCRIKSNNQMGPAAVNGNNVTLSGKGVYSCTDALGNTTASQGNVNIVAYAEDNGTSGAGQDKYWVTNAASVPTNYLQMTAPAASNAALLTGGNVQVPQPGKK